MNDNDLNTPMMKQFKEIKDQHPDAFLFFRCGDFYEMFGTDAQEASRILDITLTRRGEVPMCGVPYHAADFYISKLIRSGKKIAICEQMEDPKQVKGLVRREVIQVITPGTLVEEKMLFNKSNNFLLALNKKGLYLEIAYLDLSTGDFEINEIEYSTDLSILKGELLRISPKEIIISDDIWLNDHPIRELFEEQEHILVNRFPCWFFDLEKNRDLTFKHFKLNSWKDVKITEPLTDLTTPGAILRYVIDNAKSLLDHITVLSFHNSSQTMILDETTVKNLELLKNLHDDSSVNTLLETMDLTITSMGGRLLKKWLIEPLINLEAIRKRQAVVDYFYKNQQLMQQLVKSLKSVMDLERLASRIVMNKANPKDLVSIKLSLTSAKEIYLLTKEIDCLKELMEFFQPLDEITQFIDQAIKDEPSTFINEGDIVKDGYHKELDELKHLSMKSKEYIAALEQREKEKLKVPSLRIKYNKILGYFFEISRLQSKNLDNSYILRQSLVNTCRYTSQELSEYESKVLTAREQINKIEESVFYQVKDTVFQNISCLQENAKIIARLDVLLAFTNLAVNHHYVRPEVDEGTQIMIREGRHPVVEEKLAIGQFIPNDLTIDTENDYLLIITGPNMSGKSTYLRQNALIVLMAQIGSFVPAQSARIGIVDRIFTRIGTSDNLSRGQSTFLVEMMETANILNHATARSFIIMDEIGRGTSTFDGLAIAWSVLEYIHNKKMLGTKTLFATHYHELTHLDKKKGIKNYSIAINESGGQITFLHKIIDKPAEQSYGIHVAKLAALPEEVILYAEGILHRLEENKGGSRAIKEIAASGQMELFDFIEVKEKKKTDKIIEELLYLDLDRLTPINCLNILTDVQKKIKKDY